MHAKVEIDDKEVERQREIQRLRERIHVLESQMPAYNVAFIPSDEMNKLMKKVEKSVHIAVRNTIIEHIKNKGLGPNAEPGTSTFIKLLRASNSANNPAADQKREKIIANFLQYHERELRTRVSDALLACQQASLLKGFMRKIFTDPRLSPPVRAGGRKPTRHNGLLQTDFDKEGKEVCFIYEGQVHKVTVWRKPPNCEYDNTDIRELRITKDRATELWKNKFLYPATLIDEANISSKNAMNKDDAHLLKHPTTTVRKFDQPPSIEKPSDKPPFPNSKAAMKSVRRRIWDDDDLDDDDDLWDDEENADTKPIRASGPNLPPRTHPKPKKR